MFYNVITIFKDTPCWIFSRTSDEVSESAKLDSCDIIFKTANIRDNSLRNIIHNTNMALMYNFMEMTGKCTFTCKSVAIAFSHRSWEKRRNGNKHTTKIRNYLRNSSLNIYPDPAAHRHSLDPTWCNPSCTAKPPSSLYELFMRSNRNTQKRK